MCVLLKGGRDAKIMCPLLIFKNVKSSYPIQGLPDSVAGVAYRTSPTAFINNNLMKAWLREVRCWGPGGPFAGDRVLWLDNASGHSSDEVQVAAQELKTMVHFFPPNSTDKVQPADRFPIQRIKEHWRRLCEKRNMEAIRRGEWTKGPKSSGSLANPGKRFFLETAAECVRLVNLESGDGDNWAKKSMVLCGLDISSDGTWRVDQLSKQLREIIEKYPEDFKRGYGELV